ncbi:MAG: hypothetical protein HN348_11795 [Proteobacteria bacterium]|nr:hypothetical protein [Pseudomonadota bacterium]
MKITKIKAVHVKVPLEKPYQISYGIVENAHAVVTQVFTDEGLVGIGEADPLPPFTAETWGSVFAAIEHYLGPRLIGSDPRNIAKANAMMDGVLGGNLLAKGAMDMALWDLAGKALGVPISRLLGGQLRDTIPLLWPFGSGKPEEEEPRIRAKMEEGYRTFMIKAGALPIDEDIARVRAIEDAFGGSININVDANQGWNLSETLDFMEGTKGCHLDFVEQPVHGHKLPAQEIIRARATHPLSADEGVQTVHQASALLRMNLVDIFSLKVSKNGGISRTHHIGQMARGFDVQCLVNSMIELGISQAAALQLAASLPNLLPGGHCFMSTLRLVDDVTNFRDWLKDAVATVPDKPGLGIDLDESKLKTYGHESMVLK